MFQELQHAIDYLDHAPAGFLSADQNGDISYLNATLAEWLDYDLAQIRVRRAETRRYRRRRGAALIAALAVTPGEVRTEVFDIDLRTRGGRPLPARVFHKVAFSADGRPGAVPHPGAQPCA